MLPITWAVSRNVRSLVVGQAMLLGGSAIAGILVSEAEDWRPFSLFVLLLLLALVSEGFRLETAKIKVSAAFLSLVLAMALLGPTPAACLGVLVMVWSCASKRSPWQSWLANLSTYAAFPLAGGTRRIHFE